MREASQDAPFAEEPFDQVFRARAVAHELERHALLELSVHALGEIHRTHPPAAELAEDAVRAEALSGSRRLPDFRQRGHDPPGVGRIEEPGGPAVCRQQGFHLHPDLGSIAAGRVEERRAVGGRPFQCFCEDLGDRLTQLDRR